MFTAFFLLQPLRLDKMDQFFASVASLMSILVRSCIETSLQDLLSFVEDYLAGNAYEGTYDVFKGLGLPNKVLPITVYLVSYVAKHSS